MCTVTFVKTREQAIITSNRDELVARPALAPQVYQVGDKTILFPKDPVAGGTWFATDAFGTVAVLLNGGFVKHVRAQSYRRSRGLIVLDIISATTAVDQWQTIGLDGIEPFTLILYQAENLYQLTWDGSRKHFQKLSESGYIWSSSTLYPESVQQQRKSLFHDFNAKHGVLGPADLLRFHNSANPHDMQNGFVIDRCGTLKTLSVTQAVVSAAVTRVSYDDLTTGQHFDSKMQHIQSKSF